MDDIGLQLKVVRLEGDVSALRTRISMLINLVEQVRIALEEDDSDEALRIINEAS